MKNTRRILSFGLALIMVTILLPGISTQAATTTTYKLCFSLNGGTGTAPAVKSVTAGNSVVLPSSSGFSRSGYTFKNWNKSISGSGTALGAGATWKPDGSWTLYAQWTQNSYTISYSANGGSGAPASQTKKGGVTLTLRSTKPTRTGYTFKKWNTKSDGSGTAYSPGASYTSNSNATLCAQWTANTYTVTLNKCNGTGGSSSKTATYGSAMPAITPPSLTGYTFKGYYDTSATSGGTQYYTTSGASARKWDKASNTTLYARWAANTYNVSFSGNGGTVPQGSPSMQPQSFTYLAEKKLTLNTFIKKGYTFAGWAKSASGSVAYKNEQSVSKLASTNGANVSLYAVWTADTYTVTLNKGNGTGGSSSKTVAYGSAMPAIGPPSLTGYTFKGYYDTSATSGGTQYYTASGASARKWDKISNTTLYAQWAANTYTVSFSGNGGTVPQGSTSMQPQSFTYLAEKKLTLNTFTKKGYTFAGWAKSASGSVAYKNGESVSKLASANGANVSLYAVWTANTYTVTLSKGDGAGGTSLKTATYGLAMPAILPPSLEGYTFLGYFDLGGTKYYNANGTSARTWDKDSNTTLCAKWEENRKGEDIPKEENRKEEDIPHEPGKEDPPYITEHEDPADTNKYTVTLNKNGGTGGTSSVSAIYGSAMPSIAIPTYAGYTFQGYYDSSASTGGTKYYNANGTSARAWNIASNKTLYARWAMEAPIDDPPYGKTSIIIVEPSIVSPSDAIFVEKGETVHFEVICSGSPTWVKIDIPISSFSKSDNEIDKVETITMAMNQDGTRFICDWEVEAGPEKQSGAAIFRECKYAYSAIGIDNCGFKQLRFYTNDGTCEYVNFAVLNYAKDYYKGIQKSLDWDTPSSTPFIAPFSGKYNCLSYVIGIYNHWNSDGVKSPSNSDLDDIIDFMLGRRAYEYRRDGKHGTAYTDVSRNVHTILYPTAIYYKDYHFAKVVEWDTNGFPTAIISKWGPKEVIKSSGYDVFKGGNLYGEAILFFK
jgi:uncharacterized repeat protein (TIGR02543 family)